MLLDLKPGQQVLEVGPGTGVFAQQMAGLVGEGGRVVGVDLNASMVAVATERAAGSGLPVTFLQGDGHHLDFPDETFDACFASLVFMHIEDQAGALREMARVTRHGGRVVISESDFESAVFNAPDVETTRTVVDSYTRSFADGRIGRKLPRLFWEAGLTDVVVEITATMPPDRASQWARSDWDGAVKRAIQEGKLDQARADAWVASLDRAVEEGHYFSAFMAFTVGGRKP